MNLIVGITLHTSLQPIAFMLLYKLFYFMPEMMFF